MSHYDSIFHQLKEKIIRESKIVDEEQQRKFVAHTFKWIFDFYASRKINPTEYRTLLNRLATYQGGKFNDYLDMLAGAAAMGPDMLELAMRPIAQFGPEAARKRSEVITKITGEPLQKPE